MYKRKTRVEDPQVLIHQLQQGPTHGQNCLLHTLPFRQPTVDYCKVNPSFIKFPLL